MSRRPPMILRVALWSILASIPVCWVALALAAAHGSADAVPPASVVLRGFGPAALVAHLAGHEEPHEPDAFGFALIDPREGRSIRMSDLLGWERAEAMRAGLRSPLARFLLESAEYRTDDASTLADLNAALGPLRRLGDRQGRLGEQMERLGAEMREHHHEIRRTARARLERAVREGRAERLHADA